MFSLYLIMGIIAVVLGIYLLVSLLKPEIFP